MENFFKFIQFFGPSNVLLLALLLYLLRIPDYVMQVYREREQQRKMDELTTRFLDAIERNTDAWMGVKAMMEEFAGRDRESSPPTAFKLKPRRDKEV